MAWSWTGTGSGKLILVKAWRSSLEAFSVIGPRAMRRPTDAGAGYYCPRASRSWREAPLLRLARSKMHEAGRRPDHSGARSSNRRAHHLSGAREVPQRVQSAAGAEEDDPRQPVRG